MPPTVAEVLFDLISANGWKGAKAWRKQADEIAPTIVGGSRKHGGPDLGPTRARKAWASLGVDGKGIWNSAPDPEFCGNAEADNPYGSEAAGLSRRVAVLRKQDRLLPPSWQRISPACG